MCYFLSTWNSDRPFPPEGTVRLLGLVLWNQSLTHPPTPCGAAGPVTTHGCGSSPVPPGQIERVGAGKPLHSGGARGRPAAPPP